MQTCAGMSTGDLLQRVAVADDVDERQQHVESRVQDAVKPSQPLDDVRALLRNDDRRLRDDDQHEEREDQQRDKTTGHERSLSGLRKIISRSTSTTLHRFAARDRHRILIARGPHGAAQFGAPNRARRNVFERHRDISDKRVDVFAGSVELHPLHQRTAKDEQRHDRDGGKEHELQPDRPRPVEHVKAGDRQGGDAEEDDVEPAGRRHFEGDENKADDEPMPPEHRAHCSR